MEQQDEFGIGWEELGNEGLGEKPNGRRTEKKWRDYYEKRGIKVEVKEKGEKIWEDRDYLWRGRRQLKQSRMMDE